VGGSVLSLATRFAAIFAESLSNQSSYGVDAKRLAELLIDGTPIVERHFGASRPGAMNVLLSRGAGHDGGQGDSATRESNLNKKVNVFLNRLLLRIYSVPALMTYLADVMPVKDTESDEEGAVNIQLDFLRLPDEIIPQLERLIAAPHKLKWFKYVKDGSARTGVEVPVAPDDMGGEEYDYAY
jgi:hypothetical protein